VQRRLVVRRPAHDDRDVEVGDELLEVERVALRRHVLGGDDRALDDQQVDPGRQRRRGELERVLRGHADRRRDAGVAHLLDAGGDQVRLHRLGVDLLQQRHRRGARGAGLAQPPVHRGGVVVAGPEALGVEHAEPTGPADGDRRVGADDGVRGAGHQRDVEPERVDLPGGGAVVDVAGAPGRDDRDLVEVVSPPGEPAHADLDRVSCSHVVHRPRKFGASTV
jgi:hypothetical protein